MNIYKYFRICPSYKNLLQGCFLHYRLITSFTSTLNRLQTQHVSNMSSAKPKVLVTRIDIPQKALDKLKEKCDVEIYPVALPIPRDELLKRIQGKNGLFCLITEKIDKELLDAAGPSLKVVSTFSVGYDHIDLDEVKARKIKVGYTPGVPTDASAELTVALLLTAGRRLFEANAELLNGGWGKCAWSPLWMTGWGLANSTVGIFGLGRIGLGVLQRLKGFNVARFIYNSRSKKKEGEDLGAEFVSFDTLLTQSDFVVITAALTDDTRDVFNAEAFAKMKSSAILVNTARGGIVDKDV
ncbi:UNVERIFIED_CONTAM: hypothetical protein GTU68_010514 [Idotea baltica]|nr:hypothetical protein [Idotea baltica]